MKKLEIIRFSSTLLSQKIKNVLLILVELNKAIDDKFPRNYSTNIEGTINNSPFRSPFETIDGKRYLVINKFMLKNSKARVGDEVDLIILGPESDPIVPEDLREQLNNSPDAQKTWNKLNGPNHRDWIRWINLAVKDETRERRIAKAIDTLSDGKRNPCCVDIYEYLLTKIIEK